MEYHRRRISGSAALFAKYRFRSGRYSCYPTVEHFGNRFGPAEVAEAFKARARLAARRPLALAVHLDAAESAPQQYLAAVRREASMLKTLGIENPRAFGIHVPSGALLADRGFLGLLAQLEETFDLAQVDSLLELDARYATPATLRALGPRFDRMRLRCADQHDEADFDDALARAAQLLGTAPDVSLCHGDVDFTPKRFAALVDHAARHGARCVVLAGTEGTGSPARAHDATLLACAIEALCDAGYENAGFDVFVRGGTRGGGPFHLRFDLLGIGAGAVTSCSDCYAVNEARPAAYAAAVNADALPVERGHRMTADDLVRRDVIHSLECLGNVSFSSVEFRHALDFRRYFAPELGLLEEMQGDGLVELYEDAIDVTREGRPLVRLAAAVFDRYLEPAAATERENFREANSFL
jgi:oxygen-independent coproporphyrinogen-3 oxidase